MISKEQKKVAFIIVAVLLIGIAVTLYRTYFKPVSPEFTDLAVKETLPLPAETVVVHIAGAVKNPGVYRVLKEKRILELLEIAGGVQPGANLDKVNLSAKPKDGQRILIPFEDSVKRELKRASKHRRNKARES